MTAASDLSMLLEADEEPPLASYREVIHSIIEHPGQLESLSEETLKLYLATNNNRLTRFFSLLHSSLPGPASSKTSEIAAQMTQVLTRIFPDLCQIIDTEIPNQALVPAFRICTSPSQPLKLRMLAKEISVCKDFLEHLVTNPSSSGIIRTWVNLPSTLALDNRTLIGWTERLINMTLGCQIGHGVAPVTQKWTQLKIIIDALHSMMDLQQTGSRFTVTKDTAKSLEMFGLPVPGSIRMVQNHITKLTESETPSILRSLVASFPCKHCLSSLRSSIPILEAGIPEDVPKDASDLELNILGKGVGSWTVLLSSPALKSIQAFSRLGLFGPIKEKLIDLASGRETSTITGNPKQKRHLQVPLSSTDCGRDLSILWQVSMSSADEMQQQRQVRIIWQVSDQATNLRFIDKIIALQRDYSKDFVHRCRQRPSEVQGEAIPMCFSDGSSQIRKPDNPLKEHDIRTVDQEIIDLANKFYALTEPMIRTVLANDLAAEFPFDLSKDEARCISHFKTASLILGRSGTGKTTCLVFKLVGKFLTSKAISGEKPARQVLLTRSNFLASKLKAYTERLIQTLGAKDSTKSGTYHYDPMTFPGPPKENLPSESVLTLTDHSYPLVCTFDHFLQLLENTAISLDRQNFEDVQRTTYPLSHEILGARQSHQPQLVDFYSFKLDYWPRFSQALIKGFSAHLVFSEIMGVIKGSESSRQTLTPLSREQYLKRSSRLAPSFASESDRSRVYDLFEVYESTKRQCGHFDYVDRVVKLLRALHREPKLRQILCKSFDEVYVDEIQDHRCLDLELLFSIARNGRGFHFAGDTAQAISQDSTFRFADVKRMIFDHFSTARRATNQDQLAHAEMFLLSKNYRSHQGILAVASIIMEMIWTGFPETVDKLEPEVGNLSGPKPVLFVGCDAKSIFTNIGDSDQLCELTHDFGAEQVILVRDAGGKAALRKQIKNAPLILTVLESKGMEFDDVTLWNFFSDCPDQAGVRSLVSLKSKLATFDRERHSAMCSELKTLYVAITRARIQLFIVEDSSDTAATVQKILSRDDSEKLIESTAPHHADFAVRVEMMQPRASVDPLAWARKAEEFMERRMLEESVMAFRKAGDHRGETTAKALLREEKARECRTKKDIEGFELNLEAAYSLYIEIELTEDAVRMLESLGQFERAARLWLVNDQPSRAARLFLKAGRPQDAISSHHNAHEHAEAAMILRTEKQWDNLVDCIVQYRDQFPAAVLRSYGLLCKLLLKQRKLTGASREHAIALLGSPTAQEECFLEYGMNENLVTLYRDQRRYEDLYHLYSKIGQLENALGLALTKNLVQPGGSLKEPEVLRMLDLTWAQRLIAGTHQALEAKFQSSSITLSPKMAISIQQWRAIQALWTSNIAEFRQHADTIGDTAAGRFLCLHKTLYHGSWAQVNHFDTIPFETVQKAIECVKDFTLKTEPDAVMAMSLVSGLWTPLDVQSRPFLLPWSPLVKNRVQNGDLDLQQVVKSWILDGIASSVLALDSRVRKLWNLKWPERCVFFLTRRFDPTRGHAECNRLHKDFSPSDCSEILQDLVHVNSLFCSLKTLYFRRIFKGAFQERYLGIRRYWLERVLKELTFLAPLEQDASAIAHVQAQIFLDDNYGHVRSSLEELLYFRLGREWGERSNYGALLEQYQLSQAFDEDVQKRLRRALSHRLYYDKRSQMQRHLGLMHSLRTSILLESSNVFQMNLRTYLRDLDNIDLLTRPTNLPARSILHSLTSSFEYLASYLILKSCEPTALLTQSWVHIHLPRISKMMHSAVSLPEADRRKQRSQYQECLSELATSFCHVLQRMYKSEAAARIIYQCSGRKHHPIPLRKRNIDCLAVILVNLAAATPLPAEFGRTWKIGKEIFDSDDVGRQYSTSRTSVELGRKLSVSVSNYHGKEGLLLVMRDHQNLAPAFVELRKQPHVQAVPFNQLCPPPSVATIDSQATKKPSDSSVQDFTEGQEQYSSSQKQIIIRLQRLWRICSRRMNINKAYADSLEGQSLSKFIKLAAQCPATFSTQDGIHTRKALFSEGVERSLKLIATSEIWDRLKNDASHCIENIDISASVDESIDEALCLNHEVENLLTEVNSTMSDANLSALIKTGQPGDIEKEIRKAGDILSKAEKVMLEARKVIDDIMRKLS